MREFLEAITILISSEKYQWIFINTLIILMSGIGMRGFARYGAYNSLRWIGKNVTESDKNKITEKARWLAFPVQMIASFLMVSCGGHSIKYELVLIDGVRVNAKAFKTIDFISEWLLFGLGTFGIYVLTFALIKGLQKKYKFEVIK